MKNKTSGAFALTALLLVPVSVFAAGDVDLLAYDRLQPPRPVPLEEQFPLISTAPPVMVAPPQMQKPVAPKPVRKKINKPVAQPDPVPAKITAVIPPAPVPEPVAVAPVAVPEPVPAPVAQPAPQPPLEIAAVPTVTYLFAAGDKVSVLVEGEADLTGIYEVMPDGKILLPLIVPVQAVGTSPAQLGEALTAAYKDGFLVDPRISVSAATPEVH